jgi:hypothetical protein
MNLHDITVPMPNIDLIAEYCSEYYSFPFRVRADRRSVEYQPAVGGAWHDVGERDTLTYTNRTLDWDRNRRLPL